MESYVKSMLEEAKERLESGIEYKNADMIKMSVGVYTQLKGIFSTESQKDSELYKNLKNNVIRAYTALCVFDPEKAINYLEEAEKYDDRDPVILNNFGFIYHMRMGNFEESTKYYQRCLEYNPTYEMAYIGIIDLYRSLRHHNLELEYAKKAVMNCPESVELWNAYGLSILHNNILTNIEEDIVSKFKKGLTLNPSKEMVCKLYVNIGHVYGIIGDYRQAIEYYFKAVQSDPYHHPAYQNILLNLHYFTDQDLLIEKVLLQLQKIIKEEGKMTKREIKNMKYISTLTDKVHEYFAKCMYKKINTGNYPVRETTSVVKDKIRVGYISSDLVDHAVSYFVNVIWKHYNDTLFDVYIYSNNIYDATSISKIRCTEYKCIKNASVDVICEQIDKDNIDILIDFSGYTSGNRLDIFAEYHQRSKRPIMITYVGYPGNIGMPLVHRISDVYTESCTKGNTFNMKKLFLCYTPKPEMMTLEYKIYKKPITEETIVFGCFAKLQKISPTMIILWKVLLEKLPKAKLVLDSKYFKDVKILEKWKLKFQGFEKRILFLKGTKSSKEYLRLFTLIDIYLDTYPYAGTTITSESLFMNVPVITYSPETPGTPHVSRVTGSIINTIGLKDQCVATTKASYVQKAIDLIPLVHTLNVRKLFEKNIISKGKEFMEEFEDKLTEIFMEENLSKEVERIVG